MDFRESRSEQRSCAGMIGLVVTCSVTMIAFAANSILGRMALRPHFGPDERVEVLSDPAIYTMIRITSGALVLMLICWMRTRRDENVPSIKVNRWLMAWMLTVYAVGFSFAYIQLDTASGTLILFAWVQLTMVLAGVFRNEIPNQWELGGVLLATLGLVYLVLPELQTPLIREAILMSVAGVAWGLYSFLGKGSVDPISDYAGNFIRAVPLVLVLGWLAVYCIPMSKNFDLPATGIYLTPRGFLLAIVSGGLTSGVGYALWYRLLPRITATQAAAVQLTVPIIAAVGGVFFADDRLNGRIVMAGILIILGIGLTVFKKGARP